MKQYIADLHVHTLLSPCAEVEMTPHNIVAHAAAHNVDILAITDHNACDNLAAAIQVAADYGIVVIPGMELETKEEIHVVVLFAKMRQLMQFAGFVDSRRSGKLNVAEKFGPQFVVNADDELISEKLEMLICPVNIPIAEAVTKIHELGGIAIAAHIDRPANGIISILGFIPPDLPLDAVEVSRRIKLADARQKFKFVKQPFLTSSDAHIMDDFVNGGKTKLLLAEPSFAELVQAIKSENGRKILLE
ncbi:MAG: PHP domain-containing protein [Bacillota bacterium]